MDIGFQGLSTSSASLHARPRPHGPHGPAGRQARVGQHTWKKEDRPKSVALSCALAVLSSSRKFSGCDKARTSTAHQHTPALISHCRCAPPSQTRGCLHALMLSWPHGAHGPESRASLHQSFPEGCRYPGFGIATCRAATSWWMNACMQTPPTTRPQPCR